MTLTHTFPLFSVILGSGLQRTSHISSSLLPDTGPSWASTGSSAPSRQTSNHRLVQEVCSDVSRLSVKPSHTVSTVMSATPESHSTFSAPSGLWLCLVWLPSFGWFPRLRLGMMMWWMERLSRRWGRQRIWKSECGNLKRASRSCKSGCNGSA